MKLSDISREHFIYCWESKEIEGSDYSPRPHISGNFQIVLNDLQENILVSLELTYWVNLGTL